jgi:hypothetical protein
MFATQHTAPASVLALTAPARWLVLDLETGDAPEEAIQDVIDAWKPPANLKNPEKIETRRREAFDKIPERAALLDASPILCVAIQTDRTAILFNGMDSREYKCEGWRHNASGTERRMLEDLRVWLDTNTAPDTVLAGHNIRGFDLPKLRNAYLRHKLRLPAILAPRILDGDQTAAVVDTAALFKAYSMEHRDDFCPGLDTVAAGLGIPRPKGVISGADVPRLHRAGEFAAILTYCAVDAAATARAYLLMTGQADDLT